MADLMRFFSGRRTFAAAAALFVVALAVFCFLQFSTGQIVGYDGFYHARVASLIVDSHGALPEMDWWSQSVNSGVDQYLLFHYLMAPFMLLGVVSGAKLFAAVFAALTVVCLYFWLSAEKVKYPWAYPLLVFVSSYVFLYRFTLPRPHLLTIPVLTLAYLLARRKRYLWLAVLAALFSLAYVAFPLLILLVCAVAAFSALRRDDPRPDYLLPVSAIIGSAAGIALNPYFPKNIILFWRVLSGGFFIPAAGLILPIDARPYGSIGDFLYVVWPTLIIFLLAVALLVFYVWQKRPLRSLSLSTLVSASFATLFFILTILHRRSIEYWVPLSSLFLASAIHDVLPSAKGGAISLLKKHARPIATVLVLLLLVYGAYSVSRLGKAIRSSGDAEGLFGLQECASYVRIYSSPSSVVFTRWDIFAPLFFFNQENTYVVGIDPTFLYYRNPGLYKKYRELTEMRAMDPHTILKKDFGAQYAIIEKGDKDFADYLLTYQGMALAFNAKSCLVIKIA